MRLSGMVYACALAVLPVAPALAGVYTTNVYWTMGDQAGQLAAVCYAMLPDERPMAVPRTLVVDNSLPNGTTVFSWGYGEAFSDFVLTCTSSGISTSLSPGTNTRGWLVVGSGISSPTSQGLYVNDIGLRLRPWLRFNTSTAPCPTCSGLYYLTWLTNPYFYQLGANVEFDLSLSYSPQAGQQMHGYPIGGGRYLYPSFTGSVSVRLDLVKVGNLSYPGTLSVQTTNALYAIPKYTGLITDGVTDFLAGSGIRVVPPSCRLRTQDYTLQMGRWAADAPGYLGTPAYGAQIPVNLSLECSGKINHLRFRFEDTGTSLSGNQNISLYDAAGGNKINGLEIELLYSGSKVSVDNATLTDTGSHGVTKANSGSVPLYDSASTATFQARYVQSGAITRSGVNYTGPVTGKVNMHVTYD